MLCCGPMSLSDPAVHVAIRGYDPTTYRDNPQPSLGDPAFSSSYDKATYYFVSEGNKTKFDSQPWHYCAQYGGWCAYAISEGKLFDVDPLRYKISGEKLYFFYNGAGGDTLPKFEAEESLRIQQADLVWTSRAYSM